jgi:RNA polymerase sigma-70 factor, ECF subfamily
METLQARLARGDQAAFVELYDTFADRIGHYLLVRLGSRDDAGDALQETFLRLARTRQGFAKVANLEAYVFTVARNESARLAANRAQRERERKPLAADDLFCCSPSDAEARETAEIVAAAMGQLSPELREVVELKTYAELTFQQISRVTGAPQGTVATRYRSALAKMQTWLARQPK